MIEDTTYQNISKFYSTIFTGSLFYEIENNIHLELMDFVLLDDELDEISDEIEIDTSGKKINPYFQWVNGKIQDI